jgi:uncharacterized alpha-E superfamily protein
LEDLGPRQTGKNSSGNLQNNLENLQKRLENLQDDQSKPQNQARETAKTIQRILPFNFEKHTKVRKQTSERAYENLQTTWRRLQNNVEKTTE